jgi:hypothetical protein
LTVSTLKIFDENTRDSAMTSSSGALSAPV